MKIDDIKIVIPTCDKYIHIIEALAYTIKKYYTGKNQFIILGYKSPQFKLNENWSFVSMGEDPGPKYWSNGIIKYFTEEFKDEYFIYFTDDVVMTRHSNIDMMQMVFDYMLENKNVKKVFLQGTLDLKYSGELHMHLPNLPVKELNDLFVDVNAGQKYRTGLAAALYKTKYFLDLIKPNKSVWECDSAHIMYDGARILTTAYPIAAPTMFGHLCGQIYSPTGREYFPRWMCSSYEDTCLPYDDIMEVRKILKI